MLKYYTPIESFYRLKKTVEDDPMFDKKKAQKKLRAPLSRSGVYHRREG